MNLFACLGDRRELWESKRSGCVFHPPLVLLLEKTAKNTHKCKRDAMASLKKLKGILGKMRAEEETLRKGTPTVNFL